MKKITKFLMLVVGVALFGSIYASANVAAADPVDCSVADPAECTRIKTGETTSVVVPGKAKPVVNPE